MSSLTLLRILTVKTLCDGTLAFVSEKVILKSSVQTVLAINYTYYLIH